MTPAKGSPKTVASRRLGGRPERRQPLGLTADRRCFSHQARRLRLNGASFAQVSPRLDRIRILPIDSPSL